MSEHQSALSDPTPGADPGTLDTRVRPTRRAVLTGGAALAAVGFVPGTAQAAGRRGAGPNVRVTVLGTTDLHGNVFNWDYFSNREYTDRDLNDVGLAKISTLVNAIREERGERGTLLVDAGDTIQGTPLAYYYAKIDPIIEGSVHPMAEAMNLLRYDAAALGNHEFNYGIPLLRRFEEQCDFPLLGANAVDAASGRPAFRPYVIEEVRVGRHTLKVGVLGLTNPGIAIWDRAHVEGVMEFPGLVEQATVFVPQMRAAGADLVIVSAHSGADTSSSYGDALPVPENAATLVAEQVPGIDAILVGHAHKEIVERWVTNAETGRQVLLTEPLRWGMRLSVMTFDLKLTRTGWVVRSAGAQLLNANTVDEDPLVVAALTKQHDLVVDYVNSVIGTSLQPMSAARAVVEDVAAIDFVNHVQALTVQEALAGSADGSLPVLSIAAPFNRGAAIPEGEVTVRDVAGLYIYDNTLLAVRITGAQLRDYLEFSARYFKKVTGTGPFTMDQVTNAVTPTAPNGTPDYNYDIVGGLDAALTYGIDIARDPGSRIVDLAYDGLAVTDDQQFVLAVNNYRQSGGGNFPHVKDAPVVYNRQVEIRQLIIDWVSEVGVVDASAFASVDWRLLSGGAPVTVA